MIYRLSVVLKLIACAEILAFGGKRVKRFILSFFFIIEIPAGGGGGGGSGTGGGSGRSAGRGMPRQSSDRGSRRRDNLPRFSSRPRSPK